MGLPARPGRVLTMTTCSVAMVMLLGAWGDADDGVGVVGGRTFKG